MVLLIVAFENQNYIIMWIGALIVSIDQWHNLKWKLYLAKSSGIIWNENFI